MWNGINVNINEYRYWHDINLFGTFCGFVLRKFAVADILFNITVPSSGYIDFTSFYTLNEFKQLLGPHECWFTSSFSAICTIFNFV